MGDKIRLTRIMRIDKCELLEMLKSKIFKFQAGTSWSGPDCEDSFEVAYHFEGIEVFVNYNANTSEVERPKDWEKFEEIKRLNSEDEEIPEELEQYALDEKVNENLDEYINKKEWNLKIEDIESILEEINEDGFDSWLGKADTGYVDLDLV
jgi:hypothetical protein